MSGASIVEAKADLRARMLALRRSARGAPDLRPHLEGVPAWRGARSVAGYRAVRGEMDVSALLADAGARNCQVVLPRVVGRELAFHIWTGEVLRAGVLGIPEPGAGLPVVDPSGLDVLLVPGVAFDRAGRRLGQGGGYYDRVLSRRRGVAVGVAWAFQVVEAVPTESWDQRVDFLLTEEGLLDTRHWRP